jgi:hypothetical protein
MSSPIQYSKDAGSAVTRASAQRYHQEYQGQPQLGAVNCPRCEARLRPDRTPASLMDSCGFESYHLECDACGIQLAGIVDPYDDALLLSEPS